MYKPKYELEGFGIRGTKYGRPRVVATLQRVTETEQGAYPDQLVIEKELTKELVAKLLEPELDVINS